MRKESARTGTLRLIDVQDYDLSACAAQHVERTGAIGVIAIGSVGKDSRADSRVEFLCGGRALQRFRVWKGALSAIQKHLSVPPIEMAASIERMQDEAKAAQRHIRGFQEKLAAHEAHAPAGKRVAGDRKRSRVGCPGDQGDRDGDHRGGSTCGGRAVHHRDAGTSRDRARRSSTARCGSDVETAGCECYGRKGRRGKSGTSRKAGGIALRPSPDLPHFLYAL
jgi:hypothetical protein